MLLVYLLIKLIKWIVITIWLWYRDDDNNNKMYNNKNNNINNNHINIHLFTGWIG